MTSLDLFSTPADDDERSERSEVAEVVRQALADGPKPRTEVVLAVKAAGLTVSDKTVQRACRSLGVDSKPGDTAPRGFSLSPIWTAWQA